jgi:hypothetical protein
MSQNRVHTYLFLVDERNIYRYEVRKNEIKKTVDYIILKYKDNEKSQPFTDNFWAEWKENAGYIEGDKVDFAFLSDDMNFQFPSLEMFSFTNPTDYFNIEKIKQYMEEKIEYNDLSFVFNEREEKIIKCKLGYKGPKKFYLSIPYPSENIIEKSSNGEYSLGTHIKKKAQEYENNYK